MKQNIRFCNKYEIMKQKMRFCNKYEIMKQNMRFCNKYEIMKQLRNSAKLREIINATIYSAIKMRFCNQQRNFSTKYHVIPHVGKICIR